jgi:Na+/phosphate symporter
MSIAFEREFNVSIKNLILKIRFENTQISLFVCTIEDILKEKISHNVKLDIIQRIFLKRWREILRQNMNLTMNFFIHWNYDDETQTIMINRHFKTTLFMKQSRDQHIIQFWLKSINDEQSMFSTFSIMNDEWTWSKNKQNFVIKFNTRVRECFDW